MPWLERCFTSGLETLFDRFETLFDRTEGCYRFDSRLFFSDVRKGRYRVRPSDVEHYLNVFDANQKGCNNIQSNQGESDDIPSIEACEHMAPAQNEAVKASNEGSIPDYIEKVEAFLGQNNIALEENQRQAIRAVILKLQGKTNAQIFKELIPEAPFRTDHKGRGSKMVITGLAILRDNGVDVTP